jgi:Domain of unknown function (DUF4062)
MEKRYQVFVSSTYVDLKEERRRVLEAVIETGGIPAGMELFPAADEEQFSFIKQVIDDCDYYVLIIGGRYGSTTAEGISFTEKEYDYAVSRKLPVIALIHANPGQIILDKSEKDPALQEKLAEFRTRVSTGRIVKYYNTADELHAHATVALVHAMKNYPGIGWVRANKPASAEILQEIHELRKQNDALRQAVGKLRPELDNLAELDDTFALTGVAREYYQPEMTVWKAVFTWGEIFATIAPYLVRCPPDYDVFGILQTAARPRAGISKGAMSYALDDQNFRTVAIQLEAMALVELQYTTTTSGGSGLFWFLTPLGRKVMYERRAIKKASAPPQSAPTPSSNE